MSDSLPEEFLADLRKLEESYLAVCDPIQQSGFGGGAERWRKERQIILKAVQGDGDFLDVGCANGYLLQCLVEWAEEKAVALAPYGVDISARLIEVARQRLPQFASNFWVANAWDWTPPHKFRYVYSLSDCVPSAFFPAYITRLMDRYVERGGTLIIGAYGSYSRNQPAWNVVAGLRSCGLAVAGSASVGLLPATTIAWIEG